MDIFSPKVKTRRPLRHLTAATVAIGLVMLAQPPARAKAGDDAVAILKTMSDYIDAQQSIALLFDSDVEVITPELQKLQFASSGQALLDRPNKLHVTRHGGYADVDVYFDGKRATIYGNNINAFASLDVQGTIDQLIDKLRGELGIDAPGADLLFNHSFAGMTADVVDARHIGRGVVDGVECEHLAFRNADTDWQMDRGRSEANPAQIRHYEQDDGRRPAIHAADFGLEGEHAAADRRVCIQAAGRRQAD